MPDKKWISYIHYSKWRFVNIYKCRSVYVKCYLYWELLSQWRNLVRYLDFRNGSWVSWVSNFSF
jgi:hypothetical protein